MAIVKAENARKDIPLVSIIAVCYNHSKYVEETLNSILNQTYENIELVIIDSNSPDNSVGVIESWIKRNEVDCTFVKQTEPKNICKNLNEGLSLISGDFFQGISCDDVITETKTQEQVKLLEKDDDISFVFGNAIFIDSSSHSILNNQNFIDYHDRGVELDLVDFYSNLLKRNIVPAMSVLIRTDTARKLGGYDEELKYEDHDFWLRILANGDRAHFVNKINSSYRHHENNLHKELSNGWNEQHYWIYKKHISHPIAKKKIDSIIEKTIKSKEFNSPILRDFSRERTTHLTKKIAIKLHLPYKWYIRLKKAKAKFNKLGFWKR